MNPAPPKPHAVGTGWRSHIFNRYFFSILVALLAIGGYYAWKKSYAQDNNLAQYQLVKVQSGEIEELVSATGTIQPRDYVDVGAQVSGQLKKIHVEVGSLVKAGELLAEIDPTVFLANVDARRAQLRNLKATLEDKRSQLTLAQLQLTRQKNLAAGDATTTEQLQSAEAAVRSANAQSDALQAQIEQSESTLRADEANLNYAKIYAPIGGVVVSITARQGQTLNANQQAPTIMRIADLSTMTVQTQVSEADVNQLQPDMDVYFTTLGSRGRRWYSKLAKVEPTPVITNNVVLYNALFDVLNTERNLLPQMTAQVFFVAASAKNTLILPAAAVSLQRSAESREKGGAASRPTDGETQQSKKFETKQTGSKTSRPVPEVWAGVSAQRQREPRAAIVKLIGAEGKIEERKVQVGISNRISMQILSGLAEGEQVIAGLKLQNTQRSQASAGGVLNLGGAGRPR